MDCCKSEASWTESFRDKKGGGIGEGERMRVRESDAENLKKRYKN